MAQHDYVIDNQSAPAARADINNVLQAIATNNSGTSEPTVTYAGQWWLDTTNNYVKIRDKDNAAWVIVGELDVTNDRWMLISDSLQAASAGGIDIKNSSGTKIIDLQVASQATAEAGTNNTELMTALRTDQAITSRLDAASFLQSNTNQNTLAGGTALTTSYVDYVTTTITPSSASAKILVNLSCYMTASGTHRLGYMQLKRDATALTITEMRARLTEDAGGGNFQPLETPMSVTYIDSPATTSSVTYALQAKESSSVTMYNAIINVVEV